MSKQDDALSMKHMLYHAREALAMVEGRQRGDLDTDRMLELALTRLIEIIGEAASRVSDQTRRKYPEIPWAEIVGMRHRLIHGYDAVNLDILWDTVQIDLPPLIARLESILGEGG